MRGMRWQTQKGHIVCTINSIGICELWPSWTKRTGLAGGMFLIKNAKRSINSWELIQPLSLFPNRVFGMAL